MKGVCSEAKAKVKLFAASKRASVVKCNCPGSDVDREVADAEMDLYRCFTTGFFLDAQSVRVLVVVGSRLLKT